MARAKILSLVRLGLGFGGLGSLGLGVGFTCPHFARAAEPVLTQALTDSALSRGELKLGISGSYFRTVTNYNRDGEKIDLPENNSFQNIQGSFFAHYGATDEFTLLTHIPFVMNSVVSTDSTTQTTQITNNMRGAGDLAFGARFQPMREPLRTLIDLNAQLPLYSRLAASSWATYSAQNDVPLGNGATRFTLSGAAELPIAAETWLGLRVGYTARSSGFSNLLPYSAYLKYEEPQGIFLKAGITGELSISEDQFAAFPSTNIPNERQNTAIGGSVAYNAINPSVLKAEAVVGVYIGSTFFANAGVEHPLYGKNVPAGPAFVASFGVDFGAKQATSDYTHSNRGFHQYYLTSKVLQVNNKLGQVLIDRGRDDAVRPGELLDLFEPDGQDGSFGQTIARGRVLEVGRTRSKIQVLEYFKKITLQEGFVVRRPVH